MLIIKLIIKQLIYPAVLTLLCISIVCSSDPHDVGRDGLQLIISLKMKTTKQKIK